MAINKAGGMIRPEAAKLLIRHLRHTEVNRAFEGDATEPFIRPVPLLSSLTAHGESARRYEIQHVTSLCVHRRRESSRAVCRCESILDCSIQALRRSDRSHVGCPTFFAYLNAVLSSRQLQRLRGTPSVHTVDEELRAVRLALHRHPRANRLEVRLDAD